MAARPEPEPTEATVQREPLNTARVVATAVDLIERDGLDALTLTAVANELGVRQPALYRHVDGADALLREIGLVARELLADTLIETTIGRSRDDAVRSLATAWRSMALSRPALYQATDRYPTSGDPGLEEAVERVVGVIRQALTSFDLSDDDVVHVARSLRSSIHGFIHLELGDGHPSPIDEDASFNELIDLLIAGIHQLEQTPSRGTPTRRGDDTTR